MVQETKNTQERFSSVRKDFTNAKNEYARLEEVIKKTQSDTCGFFTTHNLDKHIPEDSCSKRSRIYG